MTHYLEQELYQLVQTDSHIFEFIETHILDGLWYWDLEHPEHEWKHPQYWHTLGYDPDEMPHCSSAWQDLIHPDDFALSKTNLQKHLADPSYPYDQTVRYRHKNGSTVWVRCRGMAIRNETGTPLRMLGVHIDITAAKQAAMAAQQAEQRASQDAALYKTILDNQSTYIIKLDRSGNYTYVNNIYQRDFATSEAHLLGQLSLPSVVTEDHKICIEATEYCFAHPGERIHRTLRKYFPDGTIRTSNWEFVGLPAADGVQEMLCIGVDISQQRQMENALAESEHRFASIAAQLAEGILVIDSDVISYMSPSYRRFWGERDAPTTTEELYANIHPDDVAFVRHQFTHAIYSKHSEVTYEYRAMSLQHHQKRYKWREDHATLLYDDTGNFQQAIVVVRDISERKRNEDALRESQALLEHTEQVANIGGWSFDVMSEQLTWSKQLYALFEVPLEQPLTLALAQSFAVDQNTLATATQRAIEHAEPFDLEVEMISLRGNHRWTRALGRPVLEDGRVVMLRGTMQDISDQKRNEIALRESQELLEYTEAAANIGGWAFDVKRQQVVWSQQVYRLLDIPTDQPLTLELALAFSLEPYKLESAVADAIQHAQPYDLELEVLTLDQNHRWLRVVGTPITKDGEVVTLRGTIQDVSERKQAELAMRESQQQLEATLHSMDDLVFVMDQDGYYREYYQPDNNPMLYAPPEVFLHKHYREVLPPHISALTDRVYAKLQQDERTHAFDYDMDINGTTRWFSAKATCRVDNKGHFAGITVVSRDITERKRAEAELEDALQEKTVLLQEIHHRVKNNLQVVASLLALQGRALSDDDAKHALEESRSRVLAMATVHKAMYESKSLSRVDFAAYLRQLVPSMLRSSSAHYVAIDYNLEPVELSIEDAIPCGLIVNELLSNALKHAFVDVERDPLVRIQLTQLEQTVHVGVIDNGCGLPAHINNDNIDTLDSLGMSIISALTGQVAGTLHLEQLEPGSAITLSFQIPQDPT